jgi:DNA-binding NarL/FixJ family response regulator
VNGYANEEIAAHLKMSRRTVEAHRARLMLKLDIHDLPGLVKYAIHADITSLNEHRHLDHK